MIDALRGFLKVYHDLIAYIQFTEWLLDLLLLDLNVGHEFLQFWDKFVLFCEFNAISLFRLISWWIRRSYIYQRLGQQVLVALLLKLQELLKLDDEQFGEVWLFQLFKLLFKVIALN